jgi:MarR family transcriptional regulator, negative regulator of the multidrug operon emrRAB
MYDAYILDFRMNKLGNLLHAMATAIADRQMLTMTAGSGLSPSAVASVLTLGQHDQQSVSDLTSVTGLSHSAVVRLIDRLEADGLVQRSEEKQGRSVPIALTDAGRTEYERLRDRQSGFLEDILAELPSNDQQDLERLVSGILSAMTTSKSARDQICRFCDEGVCEQTSCPVEQTYLKRVAQR